MLIKILVGMVIALATSTVARHYPSWGWGLGWLGMVLYLGVFAWLDAYRKPPESVQLLTVAEGDTVIISTPLRLTKEQREHIRAGMKNFVTPGVHVAVLDSGLTLSVLRKQDH